MSSVKSAHISLAKRVKNRSIFKYKPVKQDSNLQIRYTKKVNFKDTVLKKFFKKNNKKKNLQRILISKFNKRLFISPYFF